MKCEEYVPFSLLLIEWWKEKDMEEEILEKLLKKGLGFEKLSHPAVFTSEEAHLLSLPHREAEAKNLFVKGKGRYFIVKLFSSRRKPLGSAAGRSRQ